MKKAWMNYCLINISRRANKFFADDRFGETIIKENKDKVRPSANVTLDEFLREIIALNIYHLLKLEKLWSEKVVLLTMTIITQ